ncbi:MAG: hypothetical protein UU81_C0055G0002 [Microgenomates group bacterium GW2011_GWC1_41_8]|uniref:Uncharacterized protein n=2 Tax=Candidatus Roizmaniibacteriota TaxID=1752723 RepID=A0A0G0T3G5_9BACT|nr:MAG: hypothetical protein UU14_C0024G0009 [Candidatus Roizmanbacteria bacterium GW2011_GWB1_40_7]KKR94152.1 MAG: hypothetical protein UU41_C0012G0034 [Candidatus Roizmanbacteria bacterium GW2011_GWA1_41_13]KKS22388.1 MAG: hypothetical protein UU81_C0055G0002 [Microgenomates group bacterium GW2011_GWC1_41_8]OGK50340.1 MAG: hypothetical protein A3A55_01430 [Candidatus Roizmanbacteria bacterium RIFCSPLOWO2_01_FULL_40_14]
MKFAARLVLVGLFLVGATVLSAQLVSAQEPSNVDANIPTNQSVDESDNPYLQEPTGQVLPAASTPTPTTNPASLQLASSPGEPNWIIDAEVTQVGRNAERAREFIYWVVTHSPVYNVPQIYQAYFFVQRVTWILAIFVIIGLAIQLVLTRKSIGPTFSGISIGFDRITIATIVIRMVLILSFIFFSYNILLGFIQASDAMSNFFISRLGGEDLFNIVFSSSNSEENYDFVGYKNADPLEQDMVFTSLFLVRMTSFTYNFMAIILIIRQVILIFLLILSPLLALLLPFIFVRNIGSIWIGEFFRWLFYGPLFSLFIAALARIWKGGIPYEFDFTGAGTKMVYHTGINILYGGPAQVLSPTNTANYVDTYAEYIIALIMLWAAIMLPWLLLKIFRDYCCDILEKNQGVLMQILDKIRNVTPPKPLGPKPAKPGSIGTFGKHMKIPESRSVLTRETMTREKIIEKIRDREIHNVETHDITRAYDLRVSSLRDVARIETHKEKESAVRETLASIQNPLRATTPQTRTQYETLRNEFTTRASRGDKLARQVIQAATPRASHVEQTITSTASAEQLKQAVAAPGPIAISEVRVPTIRTISLETVKSVSEHTHLEQNTVQEILKAVPITETVEKEKESKTTTEKIQKVAERVHVTTDQVREVIYNAQQISQNQLIREQISTETIKSVAEKTHTEQATVEQILKEVPVTESVEKQTATAETNEKVREVSERIHVSEEQVREVVREIQKEITTTQIQRVSSDTIREISEKTQVSQESVEKVLEEVPSVNTIESKEAQIGALSEKTGVAPDQVRKVLDATPPSQIPSAEAPKIAPSVSIEEYEEIRAMWMNHYRNSDVPKSENIKNREDWINEDIAKLTNTINLLISPSVKDRQQGMQQVADLLPFLLLGGFADVETLTYIKAKLEAAKLIYEEMERVDEAKEKIKKEQEDLVVIPAVGPKEEQKTMQAEQKLEMPIPDGEQKTPSQETTYDLPGFGEESDKTANDDELDKKLPFRNITIPNLVKKK